jgi:hypothetical protein
MTEHQEHRRMPRVPLPGRPAARTRVTETVRLVDLSLTGVRLEHLNLLRPGATCTVELPSALGGLVLVAQVMWSRVMGTEPGPEGQRLLRYQSGLLFPQVTSEQQTSLAQAMEKAASGIPLEGGGLSL